MQKFVNYRLRLVIIGDISGTWRPVRPFAPSSTSRTGPDRVWFVPHLDALDARLRAVA